MSEERGEDCPIIVGGGPCAYNAEPVADFFDVFSIGEGEEALVEMTRLYIDMKESGEYTKLAFLHRLAKIPGFYVPSFYSVSYNADGTISSYTPKYDNIPIKITKRIIKDMDQLISRTGLLCRILKRFMTESYLRYIGAASEAAASVRRELFFAR